MHYIEPKSDRLARILEVWEKAKGDGTIPDRTAMSPADFLPRDLPYLIVLDVSEHGTNFTYRLVGTGVVGYVGREFTGLNISSYQHAHEEPEMIDTYVTAAKEQRPTLYDGTLKRFDREYVTYERLALPIKSSPDAEGPDQILAAFDFQYASKAKSGTVTGVWPHAS